MTVATIRFPPPDYFDDDDQEAKSYDALKSRGRVVFARGPWIESRPLYTSNKERCYRILAYGEYNNDVAAGRTSETECVSGMIFPSSSPPLAYVTDTIASKRRYSKASSSISAVAYGGRRMSFLSGGGLWNRRSRNQTKWNDQIDNTQIVEDFQHISIQRITNNQMIVLCQYLEVSDWIHDIRMLDINCRHSSESESHMKEEITKTKQQTSTMTFLIAMAMASNNCEIWAFRSIPCHDVKGMSFSLCPTRLQCIVCDVRCMTYSLSFYGWNDSIQADFSTTTIEIPALLAASGTVFGDIVVWPAIDGQEKSNIANENLSSIVDSWLYSTTTDELPQTKNVRKRVSPKHYLKGHLGSVFSIKISECGNFIASTSDDRTVRLWIHTPMVDQNNEVPDECTRHICAKQIIDLHSSYSYTLAWTGWGHTARVWNVSIVSATSDHQLGAAFPLLLSAGEDGTVRVWSPLTTTKEITHPLRGNRSSSIWTVNASEGIVVTGGNDGCVKLYTLDKRLKSKEEAIRTLNVPMDPLPSLMKGANNEVSNEANASADDNKKTKIITHYENVQGQAICGMAFYSNCRSVRSDILIATRAGGLFSLHTTTNAWCDHSNWSENIVSSDDETPAAIDDLTGTCIVAHPSGECAVIGTTEGWLIKSSLVITASSNKNTNVAFRAQSYRSIQSVSFPDVDSLLVFYARGVVIWFKFDQSPTPLHVMRLGTTGIPLSFAHDSDAMYFGDSRGNIVYFSSFRPADVHEQKPSSLLAKVHGKEHVTGLAVSSSGVLFSVGNDGCLCQSRIDSNGQLQKLMSFPIANVTGLRHIWNVPNASGIERILIGGFYGNDYVLLDYTYGELLRIATGGRQRRQDMFLNFDCNTGGLRSLEVAILTGKKDGINSIDIHDSDLHDKNIIDSIGLPCHAENINDACWIEDDCENLYLLIGSNDGTVKLSRFSENKFVSTVDLPAHESCVRGVCSSGRLLVTCGGKFSMEFYILDSTSTTLSGVALLCSYRTQGKVTTDHRMNSARATALFPPETQCHLVLAGDSDGDLHLCIISEQATSRRTVIGTKLKGDGRPILCIELLRCNSATILAFVGTTGGRISVWVLPGTLTGNSEGTLKLDGIIPSSPVYSYIGHKSGVNDIGVVKANNNRSPDDNTVIIASVGDDQALSTGILELTNMPNKISAQFYLTSEILLTTTCASASALKAVRIIVSDSNFYRIYTIDSSRITLWHLSINDHELSVKYVSSSSLGTEGSCVDCIRHKRADGSTHELIAVGGEGVAVLSLNLEILRAARKLHEANYLLITAGAGFSADSGLQTYNCGPAEYRAMCDPSKLLENSFAFQQYWLKFTQSYLETLPHVGYELLDQWCNGGRLRNLNSNSNNLSGWWVYTSNVDGFFRRFQSFAASLCEIHGSALKYRCACAIGYAYGEPRLGQEWQQWNKQIHSKDECKQTSVEMSWELLNNLTNSDQVFLCSHCQNPMRPNVVMFNDNDVNVLDPIDIERERYQTWEMAVEDEVSLDDQNLVILELGCGVAVPAVRQESMDVLMDCAKKIRSTGHGSLCMIRINPKDTKIDNDDNSFEAISVTSTAAFALQQIDFWINVFNNS